METASVKQMFQALLKNDQAMAVVVTIVMVNCSIYLTSNLVIYFFKYDFGGSSWYNSYTLFNTFGGAVQILAMMLFYPLLRRFMESLKIFYISILMAGIGYVSLLALAFINMTNVYLLFIPAFFIFGANGILSVLTTVFLANTVDYGRWKNKRSDESVIFSMQTFVVKLASGLSAFVASLALQIFQLSSQATSDQQKSIDFARATAQSSKIGLRMVMTIIPVIGLAFALIWFKKKYILSDEKMKEIEGK